MSSFTRRHDKAFRVDHTIINLDGAENIRQNHIYETVGQRMLD